MASWAGARSLCATLVVLVGAAATAPAAWSTFPGLNQSFPGLNGHLAYEARSGATSNIFSIQPLAGASAQRTQLTDGRAIDRDAAWHPDGQQIAFTSDRDGNDEIYLKGAEPSARPTRLTTDPAADTDPTFSPDGTQLAFTSTRDGNPEIYVMEIDGSAQRRLTVDPATDQQADWSPDGTRIAFESNRDGDMELYTMSPDGSGVTQLTFSPDFDADASWHPDGTRIAFVSGAGGVFDIFTLRPGTDGRTRLTRTSGDAHFPAWSPDGQQIAFTSYGETRVMKADPGAEATFAANGVDAAWGPLLPPPPVPEFKKTMNLETTTGTVFVRMKGAAAAAPLETEDAGEIPVGGARCDPDAPASTCTVIDTRQGELEIEAATTASKRSTSSVAVSEGRATLSQDRAGVTVLRLPRQGCGAPPNRLRTRTPEPVAAASASSARRKKKKKKKWASQDDKNNYSSGQTDFTTTRTCKKTTIRVRDGVVEVTNLKTGRTVGFVRAGQSRSFAAR
jgi:dipeptidyl aminopeptidase/acylaminoacyl peptidase